MEDLLFDAYLISFIFLIPVTKRELSFFFYFSSVLVINIVINRQLTEAVSRVYNEVTEKQFCVYFLVN